MIEENTAAGKDVGAPVAAGDADDDILTYTLGGASGGSCGGFDIDQATGQIKTKADLDAEATDGDAMVTVTATDPGAEIDTIIGDHHGHRCERAAGHNRATQTQWTWSPTPRTAMVMWRPS